jgi:polysaccharide export outer membrane protein
MAYWFHPLVWIAGRQLAVEAERACDDAVVKGMDRADYAEQLVALAARLSAAPLSSPTPRLMLSMAKRSDLSTRVSAILNPGQQRGQAGTAAAATIIGIVALLMGTVASLRAVAGHHGPASDSAVSGHQVAGAAITAPDVHQPVVQQASQDVGRPFMGRLNTAGMAALSTSTQPATITPPLASPEVAKPSAGDVSPAQSPSTAVAAVTTPYVYVIGPDDVLTITVWGQNDLAADVLVRPDGKISLPLVGDIQAAGVTPEQLRQRLIEALARFVQSPAVAVQVKAINSRRVFIVGAVAKPGVYQLSDSLTVVQLIAMAGGLTDFADRNAILITRRMDGKNVSLSFDYAAFVRGQQLEQNIPLLPGDIVVVR